jgi:hypothetical protein
MRVAVGCLILCVVGCNGAEFVKPEAASKEPDLAPVVAPVAAPAQIPETVKVDDAEWTRLAADFDVETDPFTQVVAWYPKGNSFLLGKQEYCTARITVFDGNPNVWIDCGYKFPVEFILLKSLAFKIQGKVWNIEGEVSTDISAERGTRESMVFSGNDAAEIVAAVNGIPDGDALLRMSGGKGVRDRELTKKEIEVLSRTGALFEMMLMRVAAGQSIAR